MSKVIKCSECEYCTHYRKPGNARAEFICKHPNQKYINDYLFKNKISRSVGFIDFGEKWSDECPIKTSPRWCPLKEEK